MSDPAAARTDEPVRKGGRCPTFAAFPRLRLVAPKRPWTPAEDAVIRRHWRSLTLRELAERLGRRPNTVRARAARLGLRRPRALKGRAIDAPPSEAFSDAAVFSGPVEWPIGSPEWCAVACCRIACGLPALWPGDGRDAG